MQAHVSDAIKFVVEAWNCIPSPVVLACCMETRSVFHHRCLLDPLALVVQDGTILQMEQETVRLMKSTLSELSITNPETAHFLCATGLDEVLKVTQTTADDIVTAWLHIKENTDIQVWAMKS